MVSFYDSIIEYRNQLMKGTIQKAYRGLIEYVLVENPDFRDLGALTSQIEKGTMMFIKDVEDFLSHY